MPAVYPAEPVRRDPKPSVGCPAFKSKDSVLMRPEGDPATPRTVAPGRFDFGPATPDVPKAQRLKPAAYSVTWWDPRALGLGAESSFGLRRDDLIVKDGDMFAIEDRLADHERWRAERAAVTSRKALGRARRRPPGRPMPEGPGRSISPSQHHDYCQPPAGPARRALARSSTCWRPCCSTRRRDPPQRRHGPIQCHLDGAAAAARIMRASCGDQLPACTSTRQSRDTGLLAAARRHADRRS